MIIELRLNKIYLFFKKTLQSLENILHKSKTYLTWLEISRKYTNFYRNELKYHILPNGDPRDSCVKKIHRCRHLESSEIIETLN